MPAQFDPWVLNEGLNALRDAASHLYICSSEPTTFDEATHFMRSVTRAGARGRASRGRPNYALDRMLTTVGISGADSGIVTASGTASWWAIIDMPNAGLCAHRLLTPAPVTAGHLFRLDPFPLKLADQPQG